MVKKNKTNLFNPFKPSVALDIETSQLICRAKQNDWFLYEMQHWAAIG